MIKKSEKTSRTSSIRYEITLALTIIIVIISFTFTGLHYYRAKSEYRSQLRLHLEEMANSVAKCIDADIHAKLKEPADMESEAYSNLYIKLLDFKKAFKDIRYIYTMRVTGDKVTYVIDADENIDEAMPLGALYDDADAAFLKTVKDMRKPASDKDFTRDKWGTWLSGYAPIITSDEKYDAFIGVDMAASNVIAKEKMLLKSATLQLLVALFVAIACGQVLGAFISAPIESIIVRIKRMKHGNFSDVVTSTNTDEIGELSDQLNLMSEKVGSYIEKLETELQNEREKTEDVIKQSHQVLDLLRHSNTAFILLKDLTVIDCNLAALNLFKASHRINLLTRTWSELSAEASGDRKLEEKIGTPIPWNFFDLAGEPFSHLIELTYFSDELLVCFVTYSDNSNNGLNT